MSKIYLSIVPCEDYQTWVCRYVDYEQARLHAALNAGYVRVEETGEILCDYRMEDEQ